MSTLTQMRVRFREVLKFADQTDVDEGDPAKATITKLINESINRRYASLITSYPFRFLTHLSMTYTANLESVVLPSAAQGRMISIVKALPLGVTSAILAYDLDPAGADELGSYEFYGLPCVYVIDMVATSIYLRPVPQTDTTLWLHYVAALTDLSADGNSPSWCPVEFHQLFVYDAAATYGAENGDDNAGNLQEKADEIFDSLKIFVERNFQDVRFKKRMRTLF